MITALKAERLRRGWTLREAAEKCKIDSGNYSRVEAGKLRPIKAVNDIVRGFGGAITRDQLMFPQDYMVAEPVETASEARAS